jgi:hypothetical protein
LIHPSSVGAGLQPVDVLTLGIVGLHPCRKVVVGPTRPSAEEVIHTEAEEWLGLEMGQRAARVLLSVVGIGMNGSWCRVRVQMLETPSRVGVAGSGSVPKVKVLLGIARRECSVDLADFFISQWNLDMRFAVGLLFALSSASIVILESLFVKQRRNPTRGG